MKKIKRETLEWLTGFAIGIWLLLPSRSLPEELRRMVGWAGKVTEIPPDTFSEARFWRVEWERQNAVIAHLTSTRAGLRQYNKAVKRMKADGNT